jgi:hypothetical protein
MSSHKPSLLSSVLFNTPTRFRSSTRLCPSCHDKLCSLLTNLALSRAQSVTFRKKGVWKDETLQEDEDLTDLKPKVTTIYGLVDLKQWAEDGCPLAEFLINNVIGSEVGNKLDIKCAIYLQ